MDDENGDIEVYDAYAMAEAADVAEAARRHAENKRVIKPFVEKLLARSGAHNATWLAWYRALRTCVDGKKDDLADALCQAYYHLRDKLIEARRVKRGAAPAAAAPTSLRASSVDLGFKNLAYAVLRVYVDSAVADDALLRGYNLHIVRWERVDCLKLAGLPGVNVNATNMHRLCELLMCGVAAHADSIFGTADGDAPLDYFLLENQKGGGYGGGGGSNIKTYCASHVLQACCMLHYAVKRLPRCPVVEFVSSAKKTQDADLAALLSDADDDEPKRKRAKKGEAATIKPATADEATAAVKESTDEALWRAPFTVGTEGLKFRKGMNPDPKKRAAEERRAAKKRAKTAPPLLDDGCL